ncbi:MAG TPA: hypothetical protein PLA12_08595 [Candidatus Hydrogenedens sp.]|nr:hypothetical protein [Candidatus Hydrogenedens sp.]
MGIIIVPILKMMNEFENEITIKTESDMEMQRWNNQNKIVEKNNYGSSVPCRCKHFQGRH